MNGCINNVNNIIWEKEVQIARQKVFILTAPGNLSRNILHFFFLFLFLKEHLMCKGNKGNFHDKVLKRRSIQMSSNYASSKLKHKMSFHFFINKVYMICFLFFFFQLILIINYSFKVLSEIIVLQGKK